MAIISLVESIIANYIFELGKTFSLKFKKDDIEKELKNFSNKFENSILDCGTFDDFLHLTETKVDFQNFIEYGIYKDILKEERLTKSQFISIISNKAYAYIKDNRNPSLKEISLYELEDYFQVIIDLIEKKLIKSMSKDLRYNNYLLRVKIDELIERINEAKYYRPCIEQKDIENIKIQYIKMMSEKYKTVHVYGIEELGFNNFYIRPSFFASVSENNLNSISKNLILDRGDIPVKWERIFIYSNIVSVIGGAGFGKTLFLKNMINEYKDIDVPESKNMLPIYCDLKKFAEKIRINLSYTIKDFLVDSMKYDTSIKEINQKFLDYYLEKGQCLILFDALDEVDSVERSNVHALIVAFFENINKNNKICITSRESGFIPKTRIIYRVKPVDKDDVEKYIDKLIRINKFNPNYKDKFITECKKLIANKFLQSFLMLSLLVNIYKAERRMPKSKIELYKKAVEYISKEREMGTSGECVKKANINFDLIQSIIDTDESFEKLAFLANPNNKEVAEEEIKREFLELHNVNYSSKNETLLAIKEFLKFSAERTELFVKCSEKEYKFYHKSFFEYFYSKYMIHHMDFDELCKEISSFDYSQEIPSIVIELIRDSKFSEYKKFVNLVLERIQENKLELFDYLSILVHIDEPGYLSKIYDLLFNDKKLLCENIIWKTSSKEERPINISGISRYIILSAIIHNIFSNEKVLEDKNLEKDIKTYYKEEYLKAMYMQYISAIKLYIDDNSKEKDKYKYSLDIENLNGLNFVYQYKQNIFVKKDFTKTQVVSILKTMPIKLEDKILTLKEKKSIIDDFYSNIYMKNTDNAKEYVAASSEN